MVYEAVDAGGRVYSYVVQEKLFVKDLHCSNGLQTQIPVTMVLTEFLIKEDFYILNPNRPRMGP